MRKRKSGTYTRFQDTEKERWDEIEWRERRRQWKASAETTTSCLLLSRICLFRFSSSSSSSPFTSTAWSTLSFRVSHKRRHWIPRVQWQVFIVYFCVAFIYLTCTFPPLVTAWLQRKKLTGNKTNCNKLIKVVLWYCFAGEILEGNSWWLWWRQHRLWFPLSLWHPFYLCSIFLTQRSHTLMTVILSLHEQMTTTTPFQWIRKRKNDCEESNIIHIKWGKPVDREDE